MLAATCKYTSPPCPARFKTGRVVLITPQNLEISSKSARGWKSVTSQELVHYAPTSSTPSSSTGDSVRELFPTPSCPNRKVIPPNMQQNLAQNSRIPLCVAVGVVRRVILPTGPNWEEQHNVSVLLNSPLSSLLDCHQRRERHRTPCLLDYSESLRKLDKKEEQKLSYCCLRMIRIFLCSVRLLRLLIHCSLMSSKMEHGFYLVDILWEALL
jgi:hypothetical protein